MSLNNEVKKLFTMNVNGILVPGYLKEENVRKCLSFVPSSGDILLATYPKSGTNWCAQIISLIKNRGKPPRTVDEYLNACPFLDFVGPEGLNDVTEPRCYKMHFNFKDAPKSKEARYICVIRNPKDCITSLYYYVKNDAYKFKDGSFEDLFSLFVKGEVIYNDYFDHLLSWYERRNDDNVLFLYYEKMKLNVEQAIRQVAEFMGPVYEELLKDESVLNDVVKYSGFEYMKRTTDEFSTSLFDARSPAREKEVDDQPKFVRKGVVGDWRNIFTDEQNQLLDELMIKRIGVTEMYRYWKDNCYI